MTTATVKAPISLAALATIGAAPVPVPPPIPAATKTISEPSSKVLILSRSSSAASLPTSGFPPAPRPLEIPVPRVIFNSAKLVSSACSSVLAQIICTPSMPLSTIWLTAFPPAPPTPTTLIRADDLVSFSTTVQFIVPPYLN